MLSKVDVRDFFEINRRLYGDSKFGDNEADVVCAVLQVLALQRTAMAIALHDVIVAKR